jgi:peroxiredoxin/mono/diheme cytochrome c family protein
MRNRWPLVLIALGSLAIASIPFLSSGNAEKVPAQLGKRVADFALKDTDGRLVSLADYQTQKAVVVVFTGTECPINNAFLPRLAELFKTFGAQGVQFLAINSNRQDSAEKVKQHAIANAIPFPVLKDVDNVVADLFGAQRTPEAFVLDAERRICYQGRIDDQFGIGFRRPQPTHRDLAVALEEVLAGKLVSQPMTPVAGCVIARVSRTKAEGSITYAKHVSRILQKNCQECHRPGQVAPMSLLTYDDAVAWADTIREVIQDQRMPPWYADPRYGHFENDRRLPAEDRQALLTWLDEGTPRGDDKDLPAPRQFIEGWTIGKPDLIFTMPEEFSVPAEMPKEGIPYQRFEVQTHFTEDRWLQYAESRAGAPAVVHHIIMFIVPPNEDFFPGNPKTPTLCGTAPGDMPMILPPGTAKKIPAGSTLIFEMHYTPNGVAQKDRSSLGLIFAKQPPKYQVRTVPVGEPRFRIPPGADNYKVESSFTFQEDASLIGFMPHMHLRGKDFLYEAIYPDGKSEVLLSVPRYNFNWQSVYRLEKPIRMPKGSKLHCIAHFDNSSKNPNNPDPTKAVMWGDQTWEEMMIGWCDIIVDRH